MDEYGSKALDEIETCSLNELLHTARSKLDSLDTSQEGTSFIDHVLEASQEHHAASQSHSARPQVIDIISANPATGKTSLVYHAIASATLQLEDDVQNISMADTNNVSSSASTNKGCVVVFDTDNRFSIPRLAQIMRGYLNQYLSNHAGSVQQDEQQHVESLVLQALDHVYIYSPQSLPNLIGTVQELQKHMSPNGLARHSLDRALKLIVIDSLSAFFWQTIYASEEVSDQQDIIHHVAGTNRETAQATQKLYAELVSCVKAVQLRFNCSLVTTTSSFSNEVQAPPPLSLATFKMLRSPLPNVWTSFCTHRICVVRKEVTRFPHGMSIESAMHDRAARLEVVGYGRFTGWVEAGQPPRSFSFRVDHAGVHFDA